MKLSQYRIRCGSGGFSLLSCFAALLLPTLVIAASRPTLISFQRAAIVLPENLGIVAKVRVMRIAPGTEPVTVKYSVIEETATSLKHFEVSQTELTFSGRETVKTIPIRIVNDAIVETNRTFRIRLEEIIGNAFLGTYPEIQVTLREDDRAGKVMFSAPRFVRAENRTVATVTVVRSGGKAGPLSVDYACVDCTAEAGTDYEAVSGTLIFGPGEQRKAIAVPLNDDSYYTGGRVFQIVLSNPTPPLLLGLRSTLTVQIVDNDPRPANYGKLSGTRSWDSYNFSIGGEDMWYTQQSTYNEYSYAGSNIMRQYGAIVCMISGRTYSYDARFSWEGGDRLASVTLTVSGGILNPRTQTIKF